MYSMDIEQIKKKFNTKSNDIIYISRKLNKEKKRIVDYQRKKNYYNPDEYREIDQALQALQQIKNNKNIIYRLLYSINEFFMNRGRVYKIASATAVLITIIMAIAGVFSSGKPTATLSQYNIDVGEGGNINIYNGEIESTQKPTIIDPDNPSPNYNTAKEYCDQHDYAKALQYLQLALNDQVSATGMMSFDTAAVKNTIGAVLCDLGRYDDAIESFNGAIAILKSLNSTEDIQTNICNIYMNLSNTYLTKGESARAMDCGNEAIALSKNSKDNPFIPGYYLSVGSVYCLMRDYGKANDYFLNALNLYKELKINDDGHLAMIYLNLGVVSYCEHDYEKALQYQNQCMDIASMIPENQDITQNNDMKVQKEEVLGRLYNNMATVYEARQDYAKALEYENKSLSVSISLLGNDNPGLATIYLNFGDIYTEKGSYEEADNAYQKALSLQLKYFKRDDVRVLYTYQSLGNLYRKTGDYPKAVKMVSVTIDIYENIKYDYPEFVFVYRDMGETYERQGNWKTALQWYLKASDKYEESLGKDAYDTARFDMDFAMKLRNAHDYSKALYYAEKATAAMEKSRGPDDKSTGESYFVLGYIYMSKGAYVDSSDYDNALTYFDKSLHIYEKAGDAYWTDFVNSAITSTKMLMKVKD